MEQLLVQRVLIANSLSPKGISIAKFLKSHSYQVFGIDKFEDKARDKATKFFKISLLNGGVLEIVFEVCKPDAVIYCVSEGDSLSKLDFSYLEFWNLLNCSIKKGVNKVALCTGKLSDNPKNTREISYLSMYLLAKLFEETYPIKLAVIEEKDNLLNSIKKFIMGGDKYE